MNRRQFVLASGSLAAAPALVSHAAGQSARTKFRVGVIGHTGRGNYGHQLDRVWRHVPETEIVAVADADEQGLAAAQKRLGVGRGYRDYRQMLTELRPEIVAVCPRYVDEHCEMALAAIEAGARGIYVEKPFCRTPAEADAIVAACEKHGTKCAIAHRNRYHPAVPLVESMARDALEARSARGGIAALSRMFSSGPLGRLLELRGRGKEDERGGVADLWVLGSHVINLAVHFGGQPRACSAVLLQEGCPATRKDIAEGAEGVGPVAGNQLHARFEMDCGVPFYFDSIRGVGTRSANFGLQLIGTEGIVDLRIDREPLVHLMAGNPFLPTDEPRRWVPVTSAGAGEPEPIAELGAHVADHRLAVRDLLLAIEEDREPLCSARHGRTIVEMIAGVLESHRQDGKRVTFPLTARTNPLGSLA